MNCALITGRKTIAQRLEFNKRPYEHPETYELVCIRDKHDVFVKYRSLVLRSLPNVNCLGLMKISRQLAHPPITALSGDMLHSCEVGKGFLH